MAAFQSDHWISAAIRWKYTMLSTHRTWLNILLWEQCSITRTRQRRNDFRHLLFTISLTTTTHKFNKANIIYTQIPRNNNHLPSVLQRMKWIREIYTWLSAALNYVHKIYNSTSLIIKAANFSYKIKFFWKT